MNTPLLVKIGGSLKGAGGLLDELAGYPGKLVLVHGGGPNIGEWLTKLGFETCFHEGLRVTPPEQMQVVEMVLTALGKELAAGLSQRGRKSIGLTGRDAGLLEAKVLDPRLGRVGVVTRVSSGVISSLLDAGLTPLIAPIGLDSQGALNINADTAAGAVAGALGWPAIFLTDVAGVLQDPKKPETRFTALSREETKKLLAENVISGGMIPKVEAALASLERGAPWSAIAEGGRGVLQAVLNKQAGTRFA